MNKFSKWLICGAVATIAMPALATSGDANLKSDITRWFSSVLENNNVSRFSPDKKIKISDIAATDSLVWSAWVDANRKLDEEKLPSPRPIASGDSGE